MKRKLMICFLIIATIVCILLGIQSRYNYRIKVTQLSGEGNGYIIETKENNLIIIDGGTKNDASNIEKIVKDKGNPTIVGWYLTSILPENSGALCEVINSNIDLKISNIFVSFVLDEEWYENSDITEEEKKVFKDTINTIIYGEQKQKVTDLARRGLYQMDNLYVMPLEVKEETTYQKIKDQNIALKVTNGFENIIFLGDITENRAKNFLTSNVDQYKNVKALQLTGNTFSNEINEIIRKINPEQVLVSNKEKPDYIKQETVFLKDGKEHLIEIW